MFTIREMLKKKEAKKNLESSLDFKKEVLPYIVLMFLLNLSYNFFQKVKLQKKKNPTLKNQNFCFKVQPENLRLNYVIYNFGLQFRQDLFLQTKFFCKHLHLVTGPLFV